MKHGQSIGAFGLGLRHQHCNWIMENPDTVKPTVGWFEVVSENFMHAGGRPRQVLARIGRDYPIALHGVGMSIAGTQTLSPVYLQKLRELAASLESPYVSDHLCWTSHSGVNSFDLLPLAYTAKSLKHVRTRVDMVQEKLGRRLYLENPTAYVSFQASEMSEVEFFAALCEATGCGMLFDVNNLYVNACNLGMDAEDYLAKLKPEWLCYMHLAGHSVLPEIRVDTHDAPVPDAVWSLYQAAVRRFPNVPTMVEWDGDVPDFSVLLAELAKAKAQHQLGLDLSLALPKLNTLPGVKVGATNSAAIAANAAAALEWSELQTRFWQVAIGEGAVAAASPAATRVAANFCVDVPSPPLVGINVYADAYYLRLCEVIQRAYPSLALVLGEAGLDAIMRDYVHTHPSNDYLIQNIGAGLSAFLKTCKLPDDFGVERQALVDIAAFEWAREELFDAPDSPAPIPLAVLAEIAPEDWERVAFDFIAALRVIATEFAIGPVISAVDAGTEPLRPEMLPAQFLLTRPDIDVEHSELTPVTAAALKTLLAGASFATACAQAALKADSTGATTEDEAAVVNAVAAALGEWVSAGLIHGIRLV